MKKGKTYLSRASRAGSRVGPTSLKTYIPADIVKALQIKNGDLLKWAVRGRKISIKVLKPVKEA
jgi:antitoxin component of MazEF toxin-antitoxin module